MTAVTPLERVTSALTTTTGYTPPNGRGQWKCPAHDDSTPSLSVSVGTDGRVLLVCHGGCSTATVLDEVGLTFADLYDDKQSRASPGSANAKTKVVATYVYTDENGAPLFKVLRWEGKGFSQHRYDPAHPDAKQGYVKGLSDTRRVLFHLPALMAGITAGKPVFVVEGEKDVLALEGVGCIATCNPMGADKGKGDTWRSEFTPVLRGADVIVVADNDHQGLRHAAYVVAQTSGVAKSVQMVRAAKGKDAADHLGEGLTVEQFEQVEQVTDRVEEPDEYDGYNLAGVDISWDPIDLGPSWRGEKVRPAATVFQRDDGVALLLPGINYLHGDSGDGKSFVAQLAAAAELKAGAPVIWVTYEDANEDLIVDRLRLLGATIDEVRDLIFITPQEGLTHGAHYVGSLAAEAGARLMVLDSVGEAMAVGGVNEDKDNEVGPWFRQTLRVISEIAPAVAIWPIDHSTKAKDNPLFPSGSKRKRAAPTGRAYLLNVRQPLAVGAVGYLQLIVAKDRGGTFKRGAIAAEIRFDATTDPYTVAITGPRDGDSYSPKVQRRNAAERVREVLGESAVGLTAEHVYRIVNGPDRARPGEGALTLGTVKNTLSKLSQGPEVSRHKDPSQQVGRHPPDLWQMSRHNRDEAEP